MSRPTGSALLLLFLFAGLGAVGLLDDYIKVAKQRSLGLRSKTKIAGQTLVALVFGGLALAPWLEDENGLTPAADAHSPSSATTRGSRCPTDVRDGAHLAGGHGDQQRRQPHRRPRRTGRRGPR